MPYSSVWTRVPRATTAVMTGSIVLCCTLASMRRTTGPPRWITPRIGACPFPTCPDPVCPSACGAAPIAPFGHGRGLALVPGHPVDLIDLHLAFQPRVRGPGHQAAAQMLRHGLSVGRAQLQLQGDLPVGEVQPHEVEAQHPHPQRLMVSGQRRAGEVVEAPSTRLAPIALPMRLGVVAPVADHRIAAAAGTAYTLAPAVLAHQREALGVVQQGREIDQIDGSHDAEAPRTSPSAPPALAFRPDRPQPRAPVPTPPP